MRHDTQQECELYAAACELATQEERAAFLERECGGNALLRERLERLLALQPAAEGFFQLDADRNLSAMPSSAAEFASAPKADSYEGPGTVIGRYQLKQKLGEGGFGIVYLAQQIEPMQREVALKIIKVGMDTREVVARFNTERQALALMEHPHIARVIDAAHGR